MDDLQSAHKVLNPGTSGLDGEISPRLLKLEGAGLQKKMLHAIEIIEQVVQGCETKNTIFCQKMAQNSYICTFEHINVD